LRRFCSLRRAGLLNRVGQGFWEEQSISASSIIKQKRGVLEASIIARLGHAMERAPLATCRLTGSWMGLAFFYGSRHRRAIATANLRLALPGLSQARVQRIAMRSAQNFGMSFCEFLHLRTASRAWLWGMA